VYPNGPDKLVRKIAFDFGEFYGTVKHVVTGHANVNACNGTGTTEQSYGNQSERDSNRFGTKPGAP
jgi:hypothetical protein